MAEVAASLKTIKAKSTGGHGGRRAGAGRKQGAVTSKTREIANKAAESGLTPLEYMLERMRDDTEQRSVRLDAAKAAAPYIHPKLANIEHTGKNGGALQVVFAQADQGVL